ncbi:MAG: PKD domain-containing protein, partial [Gemmatimonadaceae bacterium]
QLVPTTRPVFTPDGNTAYMVTDVAGDGASAKPYSFLYAIDVSTGTTIPGNQNPVANFTTNCVPRPTGGGADCTFDGRSSTDADGTIQSYAWTASGRTPKSGPIVAYAYPIGATPTISLTVSDNSGGTNTKSQQITVGGPPPPPPQNAPPVANFTSNCIVRPDGSGADCTFNASSSSDADGTIVSYAWTATGRPARSGVTVTYPYPRGSRPTISLTVTDDDGATNTKTVQITVP